MERFATDPPVEERVGTLLEERDETVAVAETCTGGMVTALLTAVPGSSAYLDRSYVPYGYDAVRTQLGVARETIDSVGVVSPDVTVELARRARDLADADWGLATTGIAGPTGGTTAKPVGTGHVGVARAAPWESGASDAQPSSHEFDGDRGAVREKLSRAALEALAEQLRSVEE